MNKKQVLKLGFTLLLLSIAFILIAGKGCPWKSDDDDDVIITGSSGGIPGAATLSSPADGVTNIPITPTLTWVAATGATSYNVNFGTTTPPLSVAINITQTSYAPGPLDYNTTYYWFVGSVNSYGSAASDIWSFRTRDRLWGAAELIETDNLGDAEIPQIAFDTSGNAIAVWQQNTGTGKTSIFANRYVSGTGWGTAQLLETDDTDNAMYPEIAFDASGNAIVVWQQITNVKYSIFANRYVSGTGWGTAQLLETDNVDHAQLPQIAFDADGNAIAVWYQNTGTGKTSIFANRYVSSTGWGTVQLLETDDTGNAEFPEIAFDASGNAIVVWEQDMIGTGIRYSIFANRYVSGTGWGTAQLLETDDTDNAMFAEIALDADGNAIAVWEQIIGTNYSIFANRYISGTGWGTAQLLETDDAGDADEPRIDFDADGRAIAVWYQWDGIRYNIWAKRFE